MRFLSSLEFLGLILLRCEEVFSFFDIFFLLVLFDFFLDLFLAQIEKIDIFVLLFILLR
jgi:hypothetical protein